MFEFNKPQSKRKFPELKESSISLRKIKSPTKIPFDSIQTFLQLEDSYDWMVALSEATGGTASIREVGDKRFPHSPPNRFFFLDEFPEQYRKDVNTLAESILRHGILTPLIVVKRSDGYLLLDGYTRFEALRALFKAGEINSSYNIPVEVYKEL